MPHHVARHIATCVCSLAIAPRTSRSCSYTTPVMNGAHGQPVGVLEPRPDVSTALACQGGAAMLTNSHVDILFWPQNLMPFRQNSWTTWCKTLTVSVQANQSSIDIQNLLMYITETDSLACTMHKTFTMWSKTAARLLYQMLLHSQDTSCALHPGSSECMSCKTCACTWLWWHSSAFHGKHCSAEGLAALRALLLPGETTHPCLCSVMIPACSAWPATQSPSYSACFVLISMSLWSASRFRELP